MQVDGTASEWLTLADASARLGISVDTLRRRIQRGEVEHRLEPTAHGPAYRVSLGVLQTIDSEPRQPAQGVDTVELLHLVERQQTTIMELSGRLGFLQAELQQRDAVILALLAPQPEPTPESRPATVAAIEERPRASWWRRVLLGE
jgi:hypothetical protein